MRICLILFVHGLRQDGYMQCCTFFLWTLSLFYHPYGAAVHRKNSADDVLVLQLLFKHLNVVKKKKVISVNLNMAWVQTVWFVYIRNCCFSYQDSLYSLYRCGKSEATLNTDWLKLDSQMKKKTHFWQVLVKQLLQLILLYIIHKRCVNEPKYKTFATCNILYIAWLPPYFSSC